MSALSSGRWPPCLVSAAVGGATSEPLTPSGMAGSQTRLGAVLQGCPTEQLLLHLSEVGGFHGIVSGFGHFWKLGPCCTKRCPEPHFGSVQDDCLAEAPSGLESSILIVIWGMAWSRGKTQDLGFGLKSQLCPSQTPGCTLCAAFLHLES